MNTFFKEPDKGDPSDVLQLFPNFSLQLLCCRSWWLRKWEFKELSFPYWRLYYNQQNGAIISYNGVDYALTNDKIVIIAPNTSFATRLFNQHFPSDGYELEGGRVVDIDSEEQFVSNGCIVHLFIHFNMGMPYDHIAPNIFVFQLDDFLREKLWAVKSHLNVDSVRFDFVSVLNIHALISSLISKISDLNWNATTKDYRILDVFNRIESDLSNDLSNIQLARIVNLSTNAFTRLFKNEVGVAPQRYVRKMRINKACVLLHHSLLTIEELALQSGFANRYHFSREFKSLTGISPAKYRKEFKY